jgi:hypothetical protein
LAPLGPGGRLLSEPPRCAPTRSPRRDRRRPPRRLAVEVGSPRSGDCPARPPFAVVAEPRSRTRGAGRRAPSPRTSRRARSTGAVRRSCGGSPRSRGRAAGRQRSGGLRGNRARPGRAGSSRGGHRSPRAGPPGSNPSPRSGRTRTLRGAPRGAGGQRRLVRRFDCRREWVSRLPARARCSLPEGQTQRAGAWGIALRSRQTPELARRREGRAKGIAQRARAAQRFRPRAAEDHREARRGPEALGQVSG